MGLVATDHNDRPTVDVKILRAYSNKQEKEPRFM